MIEYIPDFRMHDAYTTEHLTVRDLLIHSSGPAAARLLAWYGVPTLRREEIWSSAWRTSSRAAEFRQDLAVPETSCSRRPAYLAERVTGQTWEELVQRAHLQPARDEPLELLGGGLQG